MKILSIYEGHDANASIIIDGKIEISIAKERITGIKGDAGNAKLCIDYCLEALDLKLEDIDLITSSRASMPFEKYLKIIKGREYSEKEFYSEHIFELDGKKIKGYLINHHIAHLAHSFYLSEFERSVLLAIDGGGDFAQALAFAEGEANKIKNIKFSKTNLGILWAAVSTTLGFNWLYGAGKVMGLAGFGEPQYFRDLLNCYGACFENLHIKDYKSIWKDKFDLIFTKAISPSKINSNDTKDVFYGIDYFKDIIKENYLDNKNKNLAASLQKLTEEFILYFCEKLKNNFSHIENLCLSGGVALNTLANTKILEYDYFKNIFIPSNCNDSGLSIGLGLYAYYNILNNERKIIKKFNPYLGRKYTEKEIEEVLNRKELKFKKIEREELIKTTAKLLAEDKIIGFFQGRSEAGPRALGNRSILANPLKKGIKNYINSTIKLREFFRPLAPAVLSDKQHIYFKNNIKSYYMLFVDYVKEDYADLLKEVIHIDETARLQSVDRELNSVFYNLIEYFEKITKVPIVLNTSFNLKGQPIVETPQQAVDTFLKSKMDYLVIGDYLVERNESDE